MVAKKTRKRRTLITPTKNNGGTTSSNHDYMNMSKSDFETDVDEEFLIDKLATLSHKNKQSIINYAKQLTIKINSDFKKFLTKGNTTSEDNTKINSIIKEHSIIDFISDVSKL